MLAPALTSGTFLAVKLLIAVRANSAAVTLFTLVGPATVLALCVAAARPRLLLLLPVQTDAQPMLLLLLPVQTDAG